MREDKARMEARSFELTASIAREDSSFKVGEKD
jgi:hypothetical protein